MYRDIMRILLYWFTYQNEQFRSELKVIHFFFLYFKWTPPMSYVSFYKTPCSNRDFGEIMLSFTASWMRKCTWDYILDFEVRGNLLSFAKSLDLCMALNWPLTIGPTSFLLPCCSVSLLNQWVISLCSL